MKLIIKTRYGNSTYHARAIAVSSDPKEEVALGITATCTSSARFAATACAAKWLARTITGDITKADDYRDMVQLSEVEPNVFAVSVSSKMEVLQ